MTKLKIVRVTCRLDYDAKHWRHNILAWLEQVAELQRSQYLLVLESLYGEISWHDLHFEREKVRFRTLSGAVAGFKELAQNLDQTFHIIYDFIEKIEWMSFPGKRSSSRPDFRKN